MGKYTNNRFIFLLCGWTSFLENVVAVAGIGTGMGTGTGNESGNGATGDIVAIEARLFVTVGTAGGTGNGTGTGTGTDIWAEGTGESAGTAEEEYKTLLDWSVVDDDWSALQSNDVGTTWRTLPTRTTWLDPARAGGVAVVDTSRRVDCIPLKSAGTTCKTFPTLDTEDNTNINWFLW